MISVIIAPVDWPQVAAPRAPSPAPLRLDRLDQRLIKVVREEGAVQIWHLLNKIAEEETSDRRAGRAIRLALWDRLKGLIRSRLVWRHGLKAVAINPPPARPISSTASRRTRSSRRQKHLATVRSSSTQETVSTVRRGKRVIEGCQIEQVGIQLVGSNFQEDDAAKAVRQTKSALTRSEVSRAAQQLATLPRGMKKLSGWLNDRDRIWRDRKILVNGQPAYAYGALRGQVVYFLDVPRVMEPGRWGVASTSQVRLWRNPAAQLLGGMKRGIRENKSELKIAAARLNGAHPCAPGKRRGRPKSMPSH